MAFRSLPISLRDLLLSFHSPICSEQFAGNPRYTLYWCYNKEALKELLGMTRDQYRVVHSRLGTFMRRTPETDLWLNRLLNHGRLKAPLKGGLAAARRQIARKSYVGPPPPSIKQFDWVPRASGIRLYRLTLTTGCGFQNVYLSWHHWFKPGIWGLLRMSVPYNYIYIW